MPKPLIQLCLLAVLALAASCSKSAQNESSESADAAQEAAPAGAQELSRASKGWHLRDIRFVGQLPEEVRQMAQVTVEEMLVFHLVKFGEDGSYLQNDPNLTGGREVRQTRGQWEFDSDKKRILIRSQEGQPLDTLQVRAFSADSLVVETGPAELRMVYVYEPI